MAERSQEPEKQRTPLSERAAEFERRAAELAEFVSQLAAEGERSAVVLTAAKLDVQLEELLKKIIGPHPGGTDNLFHPDRPLGSFSAKIALSYRLGLFDRDCERALQLIRKMRNDFAHSIDRASLAESQYRSRLLELSRL